MPLSGIEGSWSLCFEATGDGVKGAKSRIFAGPRPSFRRAVECYAQAPYTLCQALFRLCCYAPSPSPVGGSGFETLLGMARHFELELQEHAFVRADERRVARPRVSQPAIGMDDSGEAQANGRTLPIMPVWWSMIMEGRGYVRSDRRVVSYRLLRRASS
jgi:hypothetical protein